MHFSRWQCSVMGRESGLVSLKQHYRFTGGGTALNQSYVTLKASLNRLQYEQI
uniref:Uncharacterized protein n=1 Tax=Anguilla anguilla TaxID=7936 RepID=A0A0E9VHU4_ANGAN